MIRERDRPVQITWKDVSRFVSSWPWVISQLDNRLDAETHAPASEPLSLRGSETVPMDVCEELRRDRRDSDLQEIRSALFRRQVRLAFAEGLLAELLQGLNWKVGLTPKGQS